MKFLAKTGPLVVAVSATTCAIGLSPEAAAENLLAGVADGTAESVTISTGKLQGYSADGASTYLGIPYAAPPVGDLRWMPPAAATSWDGVRDAGTFGDSCVQTTTYGVFATPSSSEDCLYLNVFAPSIQDQDDLRPVMVWIHGGSLINGRADDFDGRKLAVDGDVVVVTLNYRLNVFGYFAHPSLDAEGHPFGNYGTMDQQAALRWVRDNIRAFGGDPDNVTLFGESAGGLATLFNLVSPPAEGLFHKVILQSGVSASPQMPLEEAEQYGLQLSEALECEGIETASHCLRSASVEEITAAGAFTGKSSRVIDGEILPGQLQDLVAEGRFHRVPILIGNNLNEWTWFISLDEIASGNPMREEDYEQSFVGRFGEEGAARIASEYPLEDFSSPSEAASVAGTSANFICPSYELMASAARYVPVYTYEFIDTEAPYYFPEVSFPYGAAHTLDIQYLFPLYHGATGEPQPLDPQQQALSDAMVAYWSNFAASGDPNGEGLPEWVPWQPDAPNVQLLDSAAITTAPDSGVDRKCALWNSL